MQLPTNLPTAQHVTLAAKTSASANKLKLGTTSRRSLHRNSRGDRSNARHNEETQSIHMQVKRRVHQGFIATDADAKQEKSRRPTDVEDWLRPLSSLGPVAADALIAC